MLASWIERAQTNNVRVQMTKTGKYINELLRFQGNQLKQSQAQHHFVERQ